MPGCSYLDASPFRRNIAQTFSTYLSFNFSPPWKPPIFYFSFLSFFTLHIYYNIFFVKNQKTDYFARISELLRNITDLTEENKKRRQSLQESPCLGFDSLKRLSPFSYLKSFRISSSAMSMAVFRLFYMIRIISASRMDCFFFFFFSLSFWLWLIGEFSPR